MLTQSLAIIEYLDETHPEPPLLPRDALGRARGARAGARHRLRDPPAQQPARAALPGARAEGRRGRQEPLVPPLGRDRPGGGRAPARGAAGHRPFCHGDTPTLADCVLVPQIFNAQRFDCRLDHVPTVMRVFEACMAARAFSDDAASACPDADVSARAELAGCRDVARCGRRRRADDDARRRRQRARRCDTPEPRRSRSATTPARVAAQPAPLRRGDRRARRCSCARCTARACCGSTPPTPRRRAAARGRCRVDDRARRRLHGPGRRLPAGAVRRARRARASAPRTPAGAAWPAACSKRRVDAVCEAARVRAGATSWPGSAPASGPRRSRSAPTCSQAFGVAADAAPTAPRLALPGRARRPASGWPTCRGLARDRLRAAGVARRSAAARWCTVEDRSRFFSFRRDGVTGRMAAAVWIDGRG